MLSLLMSTLPAASSLVARQLKAKNLEAFFVVEKLPSVVSLLIE
jgi:hypothetical protein